MFVITFVLVSHWSEVGQCVLQLADCVNISEFSEVSCHSCDWPGTSGGHVTPGPDTDQVISASPVPAPPDKVKRRNVRTKDGVSFNIETLMKIYFINLVTKE